MFPDPQITQRQVRLESGQFYYIGTVGQSIMQHNATYNGIVFLS